MTSTIPLANPNAVRRNGDCTAYKDRQRRSGAAAPPPPSGMATVQSMKLKLALL